MFEDTLSIYHSFKREMTLFNPLLKRVNKFIGFSMNFSPKMTLTTQMKFELAD